VRSRLSTLSCAPSLAAKRSGRCATLWGECVGKVSSLYVANDASCGRGEQQPMHANRFNVVVLR
jgi:hypothetical protein